MKEVAYFVQGAHCASCELIIEKRLLEVSGVEFADASASRGRVLIRYADVKPSTADLNKIFQDRGYTFSEEVIRNTDRAYGRAALYLVAAAVIIILYFANRLGVATFVNVTEKSSLPMFFVLGLLAGASTCAALVGGLVLSLSKQWSSTVQKITPHLSFNAGRLVSFAVFGAVLGTLGSALRPSPVIAAIFIFGVSVFMLAMGLEMLGVKALGRFKITMPKFIARRVINGAAKKTLPCVLGAATFFLPCGFTATAQGLALLSGRPAQGALIMFFFALGTAPMLLGIGFSSVKFLQSHTLAVSFQKAAGALIVFFAVFNFNAQLNVIGAPSFNDLLAAKKNQSASIAENYGMPPMVDGKQLIQMEATARGYFPDRFRVRAGVPVRWEIMNTGAGGCTNAIIAPSLFRGEIQMPLGQIVFKEFTPQAPGKYKFTCWMGMVSGIIEVI